MYTDMVGYTALGQRNESLSLALVEEQRKLIRPILSRHNGREIKTMGDAFLVEFPSAVDAVRCAYDIQRVIREFNLSLAADKRIHLRIGIHVGEVTEYEGDISGDAVNVASRIEPLAEDGGVCLTRQVYDHAQNKIDLSLSSIGLKSLKNVSAPIEVFKMEMPWRPQSTAHQTGLDRHRVAVLPFANISPDPADEYFADGLTDELIGKLSQLKELEVIARTSAMSYKRKEKKVAEIGAELKIGSVVEGSVRKAGDRIRVTVQLINVSSESQLWSSNYDRTLNDVFVIQSDIAQQVAEALKLRLLASQLKIIEAKPTTNTEGYTLYLKGRFYWNERTKEANEKAMSYFYQAIRLDPTFAPAFSALADCYLVAQNYGWMSPAEAFALAKVNLTRALEIDSKAAEPHASLGYMHAAYDHDWGRAQHELRIAAELNPSYASAYQWHGLVLKALRRFDESHEKIMKACELDPLSRVIGVNLGEALLVLGKLDEATRQFEKVVEAYPDYSFAHRDLAWSYYLCSKTNEAIGEMRKAVDLSPSDVFFKADMAALLGFTGRIDEAHEIINELEKPSGTAYINKVAVGIAMFSVGRVDEAFRYIETGYEERSDSILYLNWWPWLEDFRKQRRWASIASRMGFSGG